MAGIFGFFDFTKPGPGVSKDEPPKPRIFVFFEVLSRKFWHLVRLNLLFFIFNIPAIIAMLFASSFYYQNILANDVTLDIFTRIFIGSLFVCIPVITVGPAQAGFTYVLRNYSREEHAWIWSDFKDNALKNFKESMIICLIDFAVVIVAGISLNFYIIQGSSNTLMSIATIFLMVGLVLFVMMHMYIYPMLVTFKLGVKQLYKNALIFAVIKFLPNLLILIVCVLVLYGLFFLPVIGIVLYPLITLSLTGLITNFYVYPKLKKYIMDKDENITTENSQI